MLKALLKKKTKALWLLCSAVLLPGLIFPSGGCGVQKSDILVSNKEIEEPGIVYIKRENAVITDFAVRLFQQSLEDEKNTLIAPVSVLCALSMVANGADENTLDQMESVMGLPVEELNEYVYTYRHHLEKTSDANNMLLFNNSIWIKDEKELTVYDSFLQINEAYYDVDIFKTAFNKSGVKKINNWINEKTQGMIPEILKEMSPDAITYLVNTLVYEGKWNQPYRDCDIRKGYFKTVDGSLQTTDFMDSEEYLYLEDEDAVGFIKYYKDKKYAFAALLPNEVNDLEEYIQGLNGKHLHDLLSNPKNTRITVSIPKFTTEYSAELSETLKQMGMTDAFDFYTADFSRLGDKPDYRIYLNRVLHETCIDVNENGTTAAAATVVEVAAETAALSEPDYEVILDRPFVFVLIDCEHSIPLFMGTVMSVE